ncbi:hypothetical protein PCNPT3_04680 [Psychromonas sp. CNPT3]|uniref:DoxX family protein n=1 Tax=Psychromonas sp. CNPT3 TaxID=314282 RepID=UPI00006E4296|nr:hypothetical protein [Psychromonas sp. CNPT3]AGH80878.1 hypothetical protein PCNPT3_04680 [Psychromonas sp. CNPT3]
MLMLIIIFLILSSPLALAFVYAKFKKLPVDINKYACWGLGLAFIFFFIGHIVKTDGMVEMLPPWLPLKVTLIYFTGVIELLVGIALFIPKWQTLAAKVGIFLFVIFFPANIYAALNSVGLGGHQLGPVYLLIRAPLQMLLIAWAYFLCVKKQDHKTNKHT